MGDKRLPRVGSKVRHRGRGATAFWATYIPESTVMLVTHRNDDSVFAVGAYTDSEGAAIVVSDWFHACDFL